MAKSFRQYYIEQVFFESEEDLYKAYDTLPPKMKSQVDSVMHSQDANMTKRFTDILQQFVQMNPNASERDYHGFLQTAALRASKPTMQAPAAKPSGFTPTQPQQPAQQQQPVAQQATATQAPPTQQPQQQVPGLGTMQSAKFMQGFKPDEDAAWKNREARPANEPVLGHAVEMPTNKKLSGVEAQRLGLNPNHPDVFQGSRTSPGANGYKYFYNRFNNTYETNPKFNG